MTQDDTTTMIPLYQFHGVEFPSQTKTEARGICPFCKHDQPKFYVNKTTGLYHCKYCDESGNPQTFLQTLWEYLFESTTKKDHELLSKQRSGIPWKVFHLLGFAYNPTTQKWVIPVFNPRGNVVNLRTWSPSGNGKSNPIFGTTGLASGLFNLQTVTSKNPIYICEGEWDAAALLGLLQKVKAPGSVVSVPGANTFKDEWKKFFQSREVILLYDNDPPGQSGQEKAAFKLQGVAKTVKTVRWTSSLPSGYDIRDFVTESLKTGSPEECFDSLRAMLHEFKVSKDYEPTVDTDLPDVSSYKKLLTIFRKHIDMNKRMEDGLALMVATVLSTKLPGDPVWLFAVGPPGSGKTLLLRSFEGSSLCVFKSRINVTSLVSGWKNGSDEDPSLMPKLKMKTLILKDWTEVLDMDKAAQDDLYALLRGAFDGVVDIQLGNGKHCFYEDLHFSIVAGVTHEIYRVNKSSLGERFLRFKVVDTLDDSYSHEKHIESALRGIPNQVEAEKECQKAISAFTSHLSSTKSFPTLNATYKTKLVSLAQVVSLLRTKVERSWDRSELAYRPTPEIGTRLAKQFSKLLQSLAVVLGKSTIDNTVYQMVYAVALDTVHGWGLDIVSHLAKQKSPQTVEEIALAVKTTNTTARRCLDNLEVLEIVRHTTTTPRGKGRPSYTYGLTKQLQELWKRSLPNR